MSNFKVHVVLDANAFMNFTPFSYECAYYTLPVIIDEIKDAQAKKAQESWPNLEIVQNLDSKFVKEITDFAKKTGDFPSLSTADLQLMALVLQLEHKIGTRIHLLRKEPLPVNDLFLFIF